MWSRAHLDRNLPDANTRDLNQGSGLLGLRDRVEALGGKLHVNSPAGSGTTLLIQLPLEGQNSAVLA